MTAAERDRYLDRMQSRLLRDSKGDVQGIKKFEGLQADLLSHSLWRTNGNLAELVKESEIQQWPTTVVSALFKEAHKLNRVGEDEDKKEEAPPKND